MPDDMWPLTGLPHLPEGYFWRITKTKDAAGPKVLYLDIRRKRFIGSRSVLWSWFYTQDSLDKYEGLTKMSDWRLRMAVTNVSEITPDVIRATAVAVRAELQEKRDMDARTAVLLGDYPPKKLEV